MTEESKKNFLKENALIIIGVSLPIILAFFFIIASKFPGKIVDDPKYDFLYTNQYYDKNTYNVRIENGVVKVYFTKSPSSINHQQYQPPTPVIKRYNAKLDSVTQINVPYPAQVEGNNPIEITVPELQKFKVDSSTVAPDGYKVVLDNDSRRGFIVGEFVGSGYRNKKCAIEKDGRRIPIPTTEDSSYCYDISFIGWVISEQ